MTYPKTQAVRLRDEVICDLLERLCRSRPLTDDESVLLAKTMLRLGTKQMRRWTRNEDKAVRRLMARRLERGPVQPFVRNDEVRVLAQRLGRSYMAVHRRMERLRQRSAIEPRKVFKREDLLGGLESASWTMNGHTRI